MSPSDVSTPFWRRFTNEGKRSLEETRALYESVGRRHRSKIWSRPDAVGHISRAITSIVKERLPLPDYAPLTEAIERCQQQLLSQEEPIFGAIEADLSQGVSLRSQVELNGKLRARGHFLEHEDEICDAMAAAFTNLASAIVDSTPHAVQSGFTVPLISAIRRPGELLDSIIGLFQGPELSAHNLFGTLNQQLYQNICKVSGISPMAEQKKPFIWPSEADMAADRLVDAYLADTPLHALLSSPYPFALPDETRAAGHWIVAPPGRGKTTLLHAMVNEDLSRDASVVLIDSKGDLIEPIKRLQSIKERLLLIEPNPESAVALNPLDTSHASVTQAVGLIEYIMAALLDAKFTALQSTLFRNVVPAIIESIPHPTLDTFKDVMADGLPTLEGVNPHARQFFENRHTGFHSKTYESTRKEVVWRLDYLLTNPVMRSMFSATHTKLDIGNEMDAGKVIIINNSKAVLGDEGAEFFGRFFVALIARAAQQRSGKPSSFKKACYVYIDECQSVIAKDTRIPVLLDECRSQKIALILSHQRTAQLTPPVLDAVANCAIRMANSDDEAKYLADKLRMGPDALRSLPRGTFGTYVRDLTPNGIQLKVSKLDFDSLPRMSDDEMRAIDERTRETFASDSTGRVTVTSSTKRGEEATSEPLTESTAKSGSPSGDPPESPPAAETDPGEPSDEW